MITFGRRKKNVAPDESEPETPKGSDLEDLFNGEESCSVESNRIYFYSDIDRSSVLKLNKALRSTSVSLQNKANELDIPTPDIMLHINSNGGNVVDGLIASDYVRKCKVPIQTIIDGCSASAATFISIVGSHRKIHQNSFMLVHQLSGELWGTFANMQDEMENCQHLMKVIKELYKRYTKMPNKLLEKTLKRDILLSSKDCLKYGFVDEII